MIGEIEIGGWGMQADIAEGSSCKQTAKDA